MIVKISGDIKPYYVQTLCMLFFPGETFSPDEKPDENTPFLSVEVSGTDEVTVSVSARADGKTGDITRVRGIKSGVTRAKTVNLCAGEAIYTLLGGLLGFYPAWGILTGVRPSKLPMAMLRQGSGVNEASEMLERDYLVSPPKAALAAKTTETELKIISRLPPRSCSVYISIPFCPTRCAYCSFISYATKRLLSLIPDYLERLCADINSLFETARDCSLNIASVYIGGGTPTVLSAPQLDRLLTAINRGLALDQAAPLEFTLEAGRPDTVTAEKLAVAASHGVTRISVNPQTTDDRVLSAIGRSHTAADFFAAYDIAAKSGIKYINTDLIAGLPGDTADSFRKSVSDVLALSPQNITVHTFSVKRSSELREKGENIYSRDGGIAPECVDFAANTLCGTGYHPYYIYRQKNTAGSLENAGYSIPGAEGLYNIFIMEEVHTILAAGAGAVTKLVGHSGESEDGLIIERLFTPKYPYEYLAENGENDMLRRIRDFYSAPNPD